MKEANHCFASIYKGAQIFAWVATPIIVACIGLLAQNYAANIQKAAIESGIQQDLVKTAIQVLRAPAQTEDSAIRSWATQIMAKYSPVPFSSKEADQLNQSVYSLLDHSPLLQRAMEARPSCPKIDIKALPDSLSKEVQQLQDICERNAADLLWLNSFINLANK
ncbi:hypothetical protein [Paenalcaligenes suwonensis]|uniref:hypothetical protein n=1 Tax=Paenalcaligenes suwonensis TaxID=1202713 RepID=UPI00140E0CAF|nr:hypothetical protein [Paenalcaligenes suwonensis]NHC63074.1 hypothetical protein [Paenalcaligenes suwonensis]